MTDTEVIKLLGCDWGTTALRVYALNVAGEVLDCRASKLGLLAARENGFEQALSTTAGDWLVPQRLVLLAGMIGARGGWLEAPYCPCPAGFAELAGQMQRVPTEIARVYVVPGVSWRDGDITEVMRGEETQLCGVLACGGGDGTYVMPGTHTKWVEVERGRISTFSTYMTGDVFGAISGNTVLQALLPLEDSWSWDEAGYERGVHEGAASSAGGELLRLLFRGRTLGLAGDLQDAQLGPYISGLLVGAEIAAAMPQARWPATLVGAKHLVAKYIHAAAVLGKQMVATSPDVAVVGLAKLAAELAHQ